MDETSNLAIAISIVSATFAAIGLAFSYRSARSADRSAKEATRANDYNEERDRATKRANLEIQPNLHVKMDGDFVVVEFDVLNHGPSTANTVRAEFSHGDNEIRDITSSNPDRLDSLAPDQIHRFSVRFTVQDQYYMGAAELAVSWNDAFSVENWIRVPCQMRGSSQSGGYIVTHFLPPQYANRQESRSDDSTPA